jgi:mRNA interferase MazF
MENKYIYDSWNEKKKNIKTVNILFRERDIWWCKLGKNIGQEQDGSGDNFSRPVLILKKLDSKTCIILPITTQENTGSWFFELNNINNKKNWAILNQIRLISVNRLYYYIGYINQEDFIKIKKQLTSLLELS